MWLAVSRVTCKHRWIGRSSADPRAPVWTWHDFRLGFLYHSEREKTASPKNLSCLAVRRSKLLVLNPPKKRFLCFRRCSPVTPPRGFTAPQARPGLRCVCAWARKVEIDSISASSCTLCWSRRSYLSWRSWGSMPCWSSIRTGESGRVFRGPRPCLHSSARSWTWSSDRLTSTKSRDSMDHFLGMPSWEGRPWQLWCIYSLGAVKLVPWRHWMHVTQVYSRWRQRTNFTAPGYKYVLAAGCVWHSDIHSIRQDLEVDHKMKVSCIKTTKLI